MGKIIFMLALAICYSSAIPVDDDTPSTRIINGQDAGENQFPYATSLQLMSASAQPYRGHRCGGVLFTLQHSLTAASCLFNHVNGVDQMINAAEYQIFAGSALITNASPDRIRPVANFTVNPEFILSSHLNDIAIVTLLSPFPPSAAAAPIALPAIDHDLADFTLCTVAGWGSADRIATASQNLKFSRKYTYNQKLCTVVFNTDLNLPNIMPTMLCAASFDSLSTGCAGDIGNALVCNNTLSGILFHDQNCGPSTFPEVYTRVNNYTTWIRTISGSSHIFANGAFMIISLAVLIFITA